MIMVKLLAFFFFDLEWCICNLRNSDTNNWESIAKFSIILQAAGGTYFFHFYTSAQ